ncbi:MAG: GerMN domain-containing protein [Oscillospiraceae bacterium]|nr:GerMN domain-containing protein [Oscillospiraceae bacterium]
MKRYAASMLLILWTISLCACSFPQAAGNDPVTFYYPWADLNAAMELDPGCTAITAEERDISGRRDSLSYLLSLYFRGPLDSSLNSPFPAGTSLLNLQQEDSTLIITLSTAFAQLKGIDLTIACNCLAQTCFELSVVQEVLIQTSQDDAETAVSVSIGRNNSLLTDTIPQTTPTE